MVSSYRLLSKRNFLFPLKLILIFVFILVVTLLFVNLVVVFFVFSNFFLYCFKRMRNLREMIRRKMARYVGCLAACPMRCKHRNKF